MLQLRRRRRDRKPGQILVLFALVLVVILAFSALIIDVGLLRNNRNSLINAMDAGALAGGTLLPVDGSLPNGQGAANAAAIKARIIQTVSATYPGLVEGPTGNYQIEYRCMIGADPATGAPLIARDIPIVCNPSHAVAPGVTASDFIGAGSTRNSACDPFAGDKCNVVQLRGAITTQFSFGRAVGVNSGSTGAITSAACNGPCGEAPFKPLDVVVIIDRSGSMDGDEANLRNAASAVLKVYNPAVHHVALAMLGPSTLTRTVQRVRTRSRSRSSRQPTDAVARLRAGHVGHELAERCHDTRHQSAVEQRQHQRAAAGRRHHGRRRRAG